MNLYVYVDSNPLKWTDPEGLDYWMEGAVESEAGYGFHQSVCVGKYNGSRKCISFGRMRGQGDCWFNCKGHIYYDRSKAGPIVSDKYRSTDASTDAKISAYFDSQAGKKDRYDIMFGNNCRAYSQKTFEHLENTYGGRSSKPPTPVPVNPTSNKPKP